MSQSYRRAVIRNPPKGEFVLVVLPPVKQGSHWYYGGRVLPAYAAPGYPAGPPDSLSSSDFQEYTIWRKWEDCLDLQKAVEREFSYFSNQRRKQQILAQFPVPLAPQSSNVSSNASSGSSAKRRPPSPIAMFVGVSDFYQQPPPRAASFDSLPSGPEPLALALDVHTLLPKLSKKTALFGRPSPQLLTQRADDFKAFVESLFQIHTPVMEDVCQSREVRDWFGYWKRDHESARKAQAQSSSAGLSSSTVLRGSPSSTSPQGKRQYLPLSPQDCLRQRSTTSLGTPLADQTSTSASSESGSSFGGNERPHRPSSRSVSAEEDDGDEEDELLDTFPPTPSTGPPSFSPIIQTESSTPSMSQQHNSNAGGIQTPASLPTPMLRSKSLEPPHPNQPNAYFSAFAVGGLMAPAPSFKPKGGFNKRRISSPPPSSSRMYTPTSPTFASTPSDPPTPATLSTISHIPGLETVPDARTARHRPMNTSASSSRRGPALHAVLEAHAQTLAAAEQDGRPSMDSFLDLALPNWTKGGENRSSIGSATPAPTLVAEEPSEPAMGKRRSATSGKRRSPVRRGGRHSISSIESYLSDSSIDAAISTLHMNSTSQPATPTPTNMSGSTVAVLPVPGGSVGNVGITGRRSFSPARNSFVSSGTRVLEENDEDPWAFEDKEMPRSRYRAAEAIAIVDEDEDVVDSYFYSPAASARSSSIADRPRRALSPPPPTPESATFAPAATSSRPSPHQHSSSFSSRRCTTSSVTSSTGINGEDIFSLKVLFPSFTDCAAIILRLPRNTTFEDLQCRLHVKLHEAEGIDLSKLSKGFRLGFKPPYPNQPGEKRSSVQSATSSACGRSRSMSTGSAGTGGSFWLDDPTALVVIRNQDDWENFVPQPKEKVTVQVIVDN
ncbi:hypothetical protein FRB99_007296 [Tulasnella sp. 403]|nr:hypothetical protein FRB99_007296 [Tulasnella sp. 403]